ncbi:MAG: PAS domain-containing protein, partial [Planctomycetota bacterium]
VIGRECFNIIDSCRMKGNCVDACPFDQVIATGQSNSIVHHTPPPNESYWEVTLSPIMEENGRIREVIETWHRITEKVMLRREVEQSEQRFRQFIDSAKDLISIKDLEGRYVVVNAASAKAFNRKEEDFIGKRAEDVLPEATAKVVNFHDKEVIWKNRHCTFEEIFEINGRDRHFFTTRFPLTDYKGDLMGVCTITRDVTERIQLQEQLLQSAKLVAVGQLAAGVAHEINNPLTGILAFAEDMLDEVEKDSSMHADLNVIIRETLRCREIVRNLLDFAKQDTPKFEMTNLNKVLDQALVLVEKLPRFKDIVIQKNRAKRIPYVQADPQQLQQVVMNLILNAADAMKGKGTVILTTEYDHRHDKCIMAVEDTGPGIPENLIDKVFEPFFSSKGTSGLGLALSWGIVERHRGIIEVDTAAGGGAIFRVTLPALADLVEDE